MVSALASIVGALALFSSPYIMANEYAGEATWYQPGRGACGAMNKPSDLIAALNKPQWQTSHCGECVTVSGPNNQTIKVQIIDMCEACTHGCLDLSPGAFQQLGGLPEGRLAIAWNWTTC
ncbi:hypothetical protein H4R34_005070 [Dimargaris verticillata]|uniref:RlpA-like protein double-psi beta-barrel domain-containing protein n=1 Tax=Dimargaris verticillata TaxID=2761393 RepID=A0A9W8E7H5_9FUNG|nr:hypothetical protein H4R34_005070 [Dimargaris verticillata]